MNDVAISYADKPVGLGSTTFLKGTLCSLAAPGTYAVKNENGKYVSPQPDGTYQERDSPGQWETFTVDSLLNLLRTTVWLQNGVNLPLAIVFHG